MKKILNFLKTNILIVKWTIGYFFVFWLILKFMFNFDMMSTHYWWRFFHATLHGFAGFVFGILVYSMIPIYIASVMIIYRKQESIITIPYIDKVKTFFTSLFAKQTTSTETENTDTEETKEEKPEEPLYPDNLPSELRVPYIRAKNHLSLSGNVSVYNKPKIDSQPNTPQEIMKEAQNNIPLPSDFDITTNIDSSDNFIPTFTDINFDEPETVEPTLTNNTTKYFESKNIEFETYKEFTATEKYLIYEHNDGDFWIMDEETWFAAGKQKDSPTKELIELAKQNGLIPVIYLQSQNIMDIEETTNKFENDGIRVIKSLDELS